MVQSLQTSVSDEEVLLDVRELQYRNEQDEVAQLTAVVSLYLYHPSAPF